MRLQGRTALVTGAGNGIGKACALTLAAHGANVVVNDLGTDEFAGGRTSAAADATVAEIEALGGKAVATYDSIAESVGVDAAVSAGVEAFGQIDIVVGCAGAMLSAELDTDDDAYHRFLSLFLSQKYFLARATVPGMLERGWGRLVFTTSHGATGLLGQPIFAAAMGGVISLTKAIAHQHRGSGVTANCLSPGAATRLHALAGPMFEQLRESGGISEEEYDQYVNTPPPEYVGPAVTWLCTDAAAEVSGEVIHAAGTEVGIWTHYGMRNLLAGSDHREHPPWSLDELDRLIPKVLLTQH